MIEVIVKSDYANSYMYLRLFVNHLNYFEIHDSVKFWEEIRLELILELFRDKSNNYELFFDYLMPDWHCPQHSEVLDYKLIEKVERFNDTNACTTSQRECSKIIFFEHIFRIFDDHDQKFQTVCLRLLCQFLHGALQNPRKYELGEILSEVLERTSSMKQPTLKKKLLEIILSVFVASKKHLSTEDATEIRSKIEQFESSKFTEMADQLEKQQVVVFHETFKKFVDESVELYGDYADAAIAHHVRLLVFIASHLKLALTVDAICRKFSFVGKNVTILTTFDELQMFNNFKVNFFENKKLEQMVSSCVQILYNFYL